jgi:hypothetical protein
MEQTEQPKIQERPSEKAPHPKTEEALIAYIREMIAWPNNTSNLDEGYGRCVYAMAYAAVATFHYVASTLGVTGFQAGCADMEFLSQRRDMKHGFMILNANDLLYPQYDLMEETAKWIAKTRPQLARAAAELLDREHLAHPDVRAHWQEIAALPPATEDNA